MLLEILRVLDDAFFAVGAHKLQFLSGLDGVSPHIETFLWAVHRSLLAGPEVLRHASPTPDRLARARAHHGLHTDIHTEQAHHFFWDVVRVLGVVLPAQIHS
jgi:hypothetical protein